MGGPIGGGVVTAPAVGGVIGAGGMDSMFGGGGGLDFFSLSTPTQPVGGYVPPKAVGHYI